MDCRDVMQSGNRHAGVRSGSLFCTPPPEDGAASFLLAVYLPQVSPESDDRGVIESVETECGDFGSKCTTPSRKLDRATCSFTEPGRPHQLITSARLQYLSDCAKDRGRSHTAHYRGQPAKALRGDSLTTLHLAPSASAAAVDLYPTAKILTATQNSFTAPLPTKISSKLNDHSFGAPPVRPAEVCLTDHPLSEEEAEAHERRVSIRFKANTRAKQDTKEYRHAYFVESLSGCSKTDTIDHPRQSSKDSSQMLKRTNSWNATTTSTAPGRMRMNDFSWGASSRSRKRSLPPTSYTATPKRPKSGPFLVESGSEDEGISDGDDDLNFEEPIAVTPEQPARRGFAQDRPRLDPGQEVKALSTSLKNPTVRQDLARDSQASKLNKNRLMTMMAKKRGGPGNLKPSSAKLQVVASSTTGKDAEHSNEATRISPLMLSAKAELRNGHWNAPRATSVWQATSKSLPAQTTSTTSQTTSARHNLQAKPTGSIEKPLLEQRRLTQGSRISDQTATQTRTQQTPSPASISTTTRKAVITYPQNAAKSSSLRDLLSAQEILRRKATQEEDNGRNEWGEVQVNRTASVSLAKDTHRTGVGASYCHRLGARKSNSQDQESRSSRGAHATTSGEVSERIGSEAHVMLSKVTRNPVWADGSREFPGRKQQQTQTGYFRNSLASDSAPTVKRRSTENLRQPDLNTRLAPPSNHQTNPRLALKKGTELVRGASAQLRNEEHSNNVADRTRQWSFDPSPTSSKTTNAYHEFARKKFQSRIVENPISKEKAVPLSSKAPSRHILSPITAQRKDQGHHTPEKPLDSVSSEAHPGARAFADSNVSPVYSKSDCDRGTDNGMGGQTPLKTRPAASPTRPETYAVESFDKEAPPSPEMVNTSNNDHIVHVTEQYASPIALTGPTMPVAIMVRPEKSSDPCRRAPLSLLESIVSKETSQTATVSSTTEWRKTPHDEEAEPMDADPDRPDTVAYQDVRDPLELATEDAISRQTSVAFSDVDKPAPAVSVDESQRRSARDSSFGLEAVPQASMITSEPERLLSIVSIDRASTEPLAAIVPPVIVSENLLPQSLAAPAVSNEAETASTEHPGPTTDVRNILLSPTLSATAEPYFEYTIHQTISSSYSSTITTELSAVPFTVLDNANAQIDKLFRSTTQQYELLGMLCRSSSFKVLDNGLSIREASFTSIEDISKSLTLKLWIERAQVSVYANHTPSLTSTAPLISKKLYALRLWRLAEQADPDSDSDSDSDVEEDQADEERRVEKERIRFYHPLPHICTEVHTSLESANRAARRVEIELSHEVAPKSMQAECQRKDLEKFTKKLEDLSMEAEEGDDESGGPSLFEYEEGRRRGCWRSIFTGVGPQKFDFELLVISVGVSGPRNI